MEETDCEQVVFCYHKATGLKAIIAINDTTFGTAIGGCRMRNYPGEEQAFTDALRLARGMTLKSSAAGLDFGGGKAVIWGDPKQKTEPLLRAMGRFIEGLHGRYITGPDMNIGPQDLAVMHKETRYVLALPEELGGAGDSSGNTALGVYQGIRACLEEVFGNDSPAGRTVAIQGVGNVGRALGVMLAERGVSIIAADPSEDNLRLAHSLFKFEEATSEEIHQVVVDIFSPNAIGAVLNDQTIPELKCKIVAGGANNQLAQARHGRMLLEKGILYAPDFVINAGGIIGGAAEYHKESPQVLLSRIEQIYTSLKQIFAASRKKGIPTQDVAVKPMLKCRKCWKCRGLLVILSNLDIYLKPISSDIELDKAWLAPSASARKTKPVIFRASVTRVMSGLEGGPLMLRSFKARLISLFVLVSLVPLLLSGIFQYYHNKNTLIDNKLRELNWQVNDTAATITSHFEKTKINLLMMAENPAWSKYFTDQTRQNFWLQEQQKMFKYVRKLFPETDEACYIDKTGQEVGRIVFDEIASEQDLSPDEEKAAFFKPAFAKNKGEIFQSEPYVSADSKRWVIANVTPIVLPDGTKPAILHYEVFLTYFQNVLKSKVNSATGDFGLIVNEHGDLIAHTGGKDLNQENFIKAVTLDPSPSFKVAMQKMAKLEKGQEYISYKGKPYYIVYSPIASDSENSWTLGIAVPEDKIFAANNFTNQIVLIGFLSLLVVILLALGFANSLSKPIQTIIKTSKQVASGDLTAKCDLNRKDEIGQLANAFDNMVEGMRSLILQMLASGQEVSGYSEKLIDNAHQALTTVKTIGTAVEDTIESVENSAQKQKESVQTTIGYVRHFTEGVERISAGANNQAKKLTGVASSILDINDRIESINASVNSVQMSSQNNVVSAKNGTEVVNKNIQSMDVIKAQVDDAAAKIGALATYSNEIKKIVDTISDVAERTNLLALNASIEAARAGEAGKGFEVVASEVRKLAESSSKSTHDITNLVNKVENLTSQVVESIKFSLTEVDGGVNLARNIQSALTEIMCSAQDADTKVQEIAVYMKEILIKNHQVGEELRSISAVAQENNSSTREMTSECTVILQAVKNIEMGASANAKAVRDVKNPTVEVEGAVQEMAGSAKHMVTVTEQLLKTIEKFEV